MIGKSLKRCDAAITTTKSLAKKLKTYVGIVFINHDVASEKRKKLRQEIIIIKDIGKKNDYIIIRYFSGIISQNPDTEIILPALLRIINEFENMKQLLLGHFILKSLNEFFSQIINDYLLISMNNLKLFQI